MGDQTPFGRFARWASHTTGQPIAFCLAVITIVIGALLRPVFRFSDNGQLVINRGRFASLEDTIRKLAKEGRERLRRGDLDPGQPSID